MSKKQYQTAILILLSLLLVVVMAIVFTKPKDQSVMSYIKTIKDKVVNKVLDYVSEQRIQTLHPQVQDKARQFLIEAEKQGIKLRVTDATRTYQQQTAEYAKGRTAGGSIVTNAKAGESSHNFGTAIDVVEIKDGQAIYKNPNWDKIAQIGKSLGFSWGGDWSGFVDKPHFELNFGYTIAQLRQKYESGDKVNGFVNLA